MSWWFVVVLGWCCGGEVGVVALASVEFAHKLIPLYKRRAPTIRKGGWGMPGAIGAKVPVVPSGKGGAVARGPASPMIMTWGRVTVEVLLLMWLSSGSVRVIWKEWHPYMRS